MASNTNGPLPIYTKSIHWNLDLKWLFQLRVDILLMSILSALLASVLIVINALKLCFTTMVWWAHIYFHKLDSAIIKVAGKLTPVNIVSVCKMLSYNIDDIQKKVGRTTSRFLQLK